MLSERSTHTCNAGERLVRVPPRPKGIVHKGGWERREYGDHWKETSSHYANGKKENWECLA